MNREAVLSLPFPAPLTRESASWTVFVKEQASRADPASLIPGSAFRIFEPQPRAALSVSSPIRHHVIRPLYVTSMIKRINMYYIEFVWTIGTGTDQKLMLCRPLDSSAQVLRRWSYFIQDVDTMEIFLKSHHLASLFTYVPSLQLISLLHLWEGHETERHTDWGRGEKKQLFPAASCVLLAAIACRWQQTPGPFRMCRKYTVVYHSPPLLKPFPR